MTVLDQRQAGVEERTPHATGSLADRPSGSKVGLELPHEAANLHVTGAALYTDDLIMRTSGVLHAWPVQAPHARALITDLRVKPAYDVDGVVRVLTAEDVPGVNDAGIKHDEPLFPSEVMFHGHAVCWVLGETLDAARRGAEAIEVDYEPLPSLMTLTEAIEQESFQGHQRTVSRGDAAAGLAAATPPVHRRVRVRRPGALLPGDPQLAGPGRRERPDLRPVLDPASRRRPRRSSPTCWAWTPTR